MGAVWGDAQRVRRRCFEQRPALAGDGDLDLLCAHGGTPRGGTCRVLCNDGRGGFAPSAGVVLPLARRDWTPLAVGDVTGDGVFDLVFGSNAYRGSETVVLRALRAADKR